MSRYTFFFKLNPYVICYALDMVFKSEETENESAPKEDHFMWLSKSFSSCKEEKPGQNR